MTRPSSGIKPQPTLVIGAVRRLSIECQLSHNNRMDHTEHQDCGHLSTILIIQLENLSQSLLVLLSLTDMEDPVEADRSRPRGGEGEGVWRRFLRGGERDREPERERPRPRS